MWKLKGPLLSRYFLLYNGILESLKQNNWLKRFSNIVQITASKVHLVKRAAKCSEGKLNLENMFIPVDDVDDDK